MKFFSRCAAERNKRVSQHPNADSAIDAAERDTAEARARLQRHSDAQGMRPFDPDECRAESETGHVPREVFPPMGRNSQHIKIGLVAISASLTLSISLTIWGQGGGRPTSTPAPTPKTSTGKKRPPTRNQGRPAESASKSASAPERAFWNKIKDSTNPDDFYAFLRKYPHGQFGDVAENKLKKLPFPPELDPFVGSWKVDRCSSDYWEGGKCTDLIGRLIVIRRDYTFTDTRNVGQRLVFKRSGEGLIIGFEDVENHVRLKAGVLEIPSVKVIGLVVYASTLEAANLKTAGPRTATPTCKTSTSPVSPNLPRTRTNQKGIEFVLIPPGEFMMGSEYGGSEKPLHCVTISNAFYMSKYEVTQAQWRAVMGNNPSTSEGDNLPVETVSWDDAASFVARLNAQNDGYVYRLPTEGEWEFACRAGTVGDYAGELDSMAWYYANAGDAPLTGSVTMDRVKGNNNRTHPVGTKSPNAFGLFDMHGNVGEWCQDWYHDDYDGAPADGSAWLGGGEQKYRVVRGGSCCGRGFALRSAGRDGYTPGSRDRDLGLRVVAVARTQ